MLNLRSPLILGAAPAGLALTALAWLGLDGGALVTAPIDQLAARLNTARPFTEPAGPLFDTNGPGLAAPIFALTAGPDAVVEPVVRLDGVAMSPRGKSALIAVDAKPAAWTDLGVTRDGITLMDVRSASVLVDTAVAFREIPLYAAPTSGSASGGGAAPKPAMRAPSPLVR